MPNNWLRHITRKRPLDTCTDSANQDEEGGAKMEKCLTTFDLVSLGVGSCCGAGMYLTAGIIAAEKAGPGGVVSILLAGLGSMLTGFHYAELAGICPETSGSAYMYTYVTVGELSAFVIGWGLIVEYVIGTSAAAVALSETFNSITERTISTFINDGLDDIGFPHIDVVAAVVCLLLTWLLASGVQMSARVNNILNTINSGAWIVFIVASLCLGSATNWSDHGGFLPYGYAGVLTAIPTAYYAFVGFDGLATTGSECKTPTKSIPISIVASVIINIIIFITVVTGLTFDVPYSQLPSTTAALDVFSMLGYVPLKYVMATGAVSGLFAATFGSLFPLPRVLQAMAQDGLIFRYFAHVCPKRHTALRATIVSGLVATFLAAFVDLNLLIELVLIGTLLSYVIVTFATLIIRYVDLSHVTTSTNGRLSVSEGQGSFAGIKRKASDCDLNGLEDEKKQMKTLSRQGSQIDADSKSMGASGGIANKGYESNEKLAYSRTGSVNSLVRRFEDSKDTTDLSKKDDSEMSSVLTFENIPPLPPLVEIPAAPSSVEKQLCKGKFLCFNVESGLLYLQQYISIFLLALFANLFGMCTILSNIKMADTLTTKTVIEITCMVVSMVSVAIMAVLLMFIPQIKSTREGFRAPCVPLITVMTAAINIYMMTSLSLVTWLLFLAWLFIGLLIYFFYGTQNSALRSKHDDDWSKSDDVKRLTTNEEGGHKVPNTCHTYGTEAAPLLH